MLIVARGGQSYARLQFGVGPGGAIEIPVEVDYGVEFIATDWSAWQAEYDACVVAATSAMLPAGGLPDDDAVSGWSHDEDGFEELGGDERTFAEGPIYDEPW
jgi:hypothetical protein